MILKDNRFLRTLLWEYDYKKLVPIYFWMHESQCHILFCWLLEIHDAPKNFLLSYAFAWDFEVLKSTPLTKILMRWNQTFPRFNVAGTWLKAHTIHSCVHCLEIQTWALRHSWAQTQTKEPLAPSFGFFMDFIWLSLWQCAKKYFLLHLDPISCIICIHTLII
jgi:hypothetical protein